MTTRLTRALLFVTYQLTVLLGVLFMPVALVARQFGLSVPFGRLVVRLGEAIDQKSGRSTR
jgi:hypothetical protein